MAISKIHQIKYGKGSIKREIQKLSERIDYIANDYKTDGSQLISSFGCTLETAAQEFINTTLQIHQRENANVAYHLKQSFKPGEVSAEEAHRIGKEYAEAILGNKYQYILTTHIDKAHIHNHLIFCATSFVEKVKYNSCTKSRFFRERINDQICKEHGLSIIEKKSGERGYRIWQEGPNKKAGENQRETIQKMVSEALNTAENYENFIVMLQEKGCEVIDNGNEFSYKLYDKKRAIRSSSIKTYDEESGNIIVNPVCQRAEIIKTLEKNALENAHKFVPTADRKILIVEVREKTEEKKNWYQAKKEDLDSLNKMVKTLNYMEENKISTDTVLETLVEEKRRKYENAKQAYTEKKEPLDKLSMSINYAQIYWKYKRLYERGLKEGTKSEFFKEHEKDILKFMKAKKFLELQKLDEKQLNIKGMIQNYKEQKPALEKLKKELDTQKEDYRKILAVKMNCETIIERKISSAHDRLIAGIEIENRKKSENLSKNNVKNQNEIR